MSNTSHIRPVYILILGTAILLFFYLNKGKNITEIFTSPSERGTPVLSDEGTFFPPSTDGPSTVIDIPSKDLPEWALINRKALTAFNQSNYQEALTLFQKALKQRPGDDILDKNIAQAYAQLGWKAIRSNRYSEAILKFDKAIEAVPGETAHYIGKALALHRLERGFEALETLETGLQLNPIEAVLYRIGGQIYYDRNEYEKAIHAWENVLQITPEDHSLSVSLEKLKREQRLFSGFQREGTNHFTLLFEGQEDRTWIRPVLQSLEDAYQEIGQTISYYPQRTIFTVLYTDQQFRDVTKSPAWTKALFDGKIHLPVGGRLQDLKLLKKLIYHEYTHALVHQLSGGKVPTWLNEGLAIFFEEKARQGKVRRTVLRERAPKSMLPLEKLHGSFMTFDKMTADRAYEVSEIATAYLIQRHGFFRIKQLLEKLSSGQPFPAAFDETFLISYKDFQTELRREAPRGR
ncbi:MAG: tetratricopeptide repeat protein [Nitrospira sp.]|nr:tetratricopeptide repeat protein [Candidatus Manganitrophaceae bacterium]HIL34538.1 tetratricopeptide repeat protein [Candidatus Manganitrophaceae bacterium]